MKTFLFATLFLGLAPIASAGDEPVPCDTTAKAEAMVVSVEKGNATGYRDNEYDVSQFAREEKAKVTEFETSHVNRHTLNESEMRRQPLLQPLKGRTGAFSFETKVGTTGVFIRGYLSVNLYYTNFTPDLNRSDIAKLRCKKISACLATETRQEQIEILTRMADTLGCP